MRVYNALKRLATHTHCESGAKSLEAKFRLHVVFGSVMVSISCDALKYTWAIPLRYLPEAHQTHP